MRRTTHGLFISLLLPGGFGPVPSHSQNAAPPVDPGLQKFYRKYEDKGVITVADHVRLGQIATRIERSHTISDADLIFWTRLLKKGPISTGHLNELEFETFVLRDMGGRKLLTPLHRQTLYAAVLPYAYDSRRLYHGTDLASLPPAMQENLLSGNQIIALQLLASTRDPRALPVLARVAHDSRHLGVSNAAGRLHNRLAAILVAPRNNQPQPKTR